MHGIDIKLSPIVVLLMTIVSFASTPQQQKNFVFILVAPLAVYDDNGFNARQLETKIAFFCCCGVDAKLTIVMHDGSVNVAHSLF